MMGEDKNNVPCCLSQRWILSYISFWGFIMVYSLRVDFSVGIVCMTATYRNLSYYDTTLNQTVEIIEQQGEFDWSKNVRSSLLAMYFYGYIILQIPGGYVATRFGGKRVLGYMTLVCSLCTLLTPVVARLHVNALFVLRFIIGLAAGVSFPAMHSIWGRWAPPLERTKLMGLCYSGPNLGVILTYSVSGVLCAYGFDNGWGSIFYITGIAGLLWCIVWFIVVTDTPQQNTRITPAERRYIEKSIGYVPQITKATKTPWVKMFKSSALWACLISHVCNNWTNYTLLTGLPLFMKEVLGFDIKQNGVLSAVPYLTMYISINVTGHIVDFLRQRGARTQTVRKIVQVTSFLGQSCSLVAVGFVPKENRYIAVVLLSISMLFTGFNRSGYVVNHVDFAPRYAGELFGITNTFATLPGMLAPIVAGLLTPNNTVEEWRVVFCVCAGISVFGAIIFGIFAKGEVQKWAIPPEAEIELEVKKPLSYLGSQQSHKFSA